MLTQDQIQEFQKRLEAASAENGSYVELTRSATLILDGNYSSSELKEMASIMSQVEATVMPLFPKEVL